MIDAHAHLWLKQNGVVDGLPVYDVGGGRIRFGREIRQMEHFRICRSFTIWRNKIPPEKEGCI